jgi:hypothetical protein
LAGSVAYFLVRDVLWELFLEALPYALGGDRIKITGRKNAVNYGRV